MKRDIAVVTPHLDAPGGSERVAARVTARLLQLGHTVTLYTARVSEAFLRDNGIEKVAVRKLPEWTGDLSDRFGKRPVEWQGLIGEHDAYLVQSFPLNKLRLPRCVWYAHEPLRLLHELRHEMPFYEGGFNASLPALFSGDAAGPARLSSPHETAVEMAAEMLTGYMPERVIANSRWTAREFEKIFRISDVGVVYPGCDLPAATRREAGDWWPDRPQRRFRVLLLGAVGFHKRWRLAVEAMQRAQDCELFVCGQGELAAARDLAERLGVQDRVHILGALGESELAKLWDRVDALVQCSIAEPFGIVPLDAAARGIPSVVAEGAGVLEILGGACIVVEPTVDALAKAFSGLAADAASYTALSESSLTVAKRHGWDRTTEELLGELLPLAASRVAPAQVDFSKEIHFYDADVRGAGDPLSADAEVGAYRSDEGWVVERHLKAMLASGTRQVVLRIRPEPSHLGYAMRCVQRILDIAAEKAPELRFGLAVSEGEGEAAALGFWSALRAPNKLYKEGQPWVCREYRVAGAAR